MNIFVRNTVLFVLFIAIQYQLWFSPYGIMLSHGLKEEMGLLSQQYQRMKKHINNMATVLRAEAREELIEDQAREVYHYVAKDEVFMPWSTYINDKK